MWRSSPKEGESACAPLWKLNSQRISYTLVRGVRGIYATQINLVWQLESLEYSKAWTREQVWKRFYKVKCYCFPVAPMYTKDSHNGSPSRKELTVRLLPRKKTFRLKIFSIFKVQAWIKSKKVFRLKNASKLHRILNHEKKSMFTRSLYDLLTCVFLCFWTLGA